MLTISALPDKAPLDCVSAPKMNITIRQLYSLLFIGIIAVHGWFELALVGADSFIALAQRSQVLPEPTVPAAVPSCTCCKAACTLGTACRCDHSRSKRQRSPGFFLQMPDCHTRPDGLGFKVEMNSVEFRFLPHAEAEQPNGFGFPAPSHPLPLSNHLQGIALAPPVPPPRA